MRLPLFASADPERSILFARGRVLSLAQLAQHGEALASALPDARYVVNLCERRAHFLALYAAALLRGMTSLMPASRAPDAIAEVRAAYASSTVCDDAWAERQTASVSGRRSASGVIEASVDAEQVVQIAFTSGSTGVPQPHAKRWRALMASTGHNAARLRECLGGGGRPWIVATVPAQHMYGTETSVLLPLGADMAVHGGRPLFPADVAGALAELPEPRVLVTAPVHLRALLASEQSLPALAAVVSATAPLDATLAAAVERRFATRLLEMFGSTETCVIATRRTAQESSFRLYPGVRLAPDAAGAAVEASWFDAPTRLSDAIERIGTDRFVVRGRSRDMVEVAGKRASLADLTRRVLAIPGVRDAVVFQPDALEGPSGSIRRVAALVVAPELSASAIVRELARSVDAAFIPRPLLIVSELPRNEVGKLTRGELQTLLKSASDPLQGP